MPAFVAPSRYALLQPLGKGGGGEVWAVEDRVDGVHYALKTLLEGANEHEVLALVREASALSGLEGLGVPRVRRFGRLPGSGRPYLLRDLVAGRSLADVLLAPSNPERVLTAVLYGVDQLTLLHRASLLHGDIKPANLIVGDDGTATLVDLGLAAPWREQGQQPTGLTPAYAAPELFEGDVLTVRAEVYSLGATLRDVASALQPHLSVDQVTALAEVVKRATAWAPAARFPSVDEFGAALRQAANLPPLANPSGADAAWPILGLESTVTRLLTAFAGARPGTVIQITGRSGAGRTALLRRLAWSLGVEGRAVAWIEAGAPNAARAVTVELAGLPDGEGGEQAAVVLLDDVEQLPTSAEAPLRRARERGAKFLVAGSVERVRALFGETEAFALPPLDRHVAVSLLRRAIPSLNDAVTNDVVTRADGRPGKLRAMVRQLDGAALVSSSDVDRALEGGPPSSLSHSSDPLVDDVTMATRLLDQGRFLEAASFVDRLAASSTLPAILVRARLLLGRGDNAGARCVLEEGRKAAERARNSRAGRFWHILLARTDVRAGRYVEAAECAERAMSSRGKIDVARTSDPLDADALACGGIAESFLGQHEKALTRLQQATVVALRSGDRRVQALAFGSLALGLQRNDQLGEAKQAYERALDIAEAAGDAGAVATTRLNLAALATHGQGAIAEALDHLEAAVDMGRRAGRQSTVQQALLNLANLDLYLGRYARAAASVNALVAEHEELAGNSGPRAQLLGLRAELAARTGEVQVAIGLYEQCAAAYEAMGRRVDAAEARIEAVLVGARSDNAEPSLLAVSLERAAASLGRTGAHRAALCLARGAVAALDRDENAARAAFDEALQTAREAGQKEWVWRALENRSCLELEYGRPLAARRDMEETLLVLEDIATRLPRDLREVYWNDPRRAAIRALVTAPSTVTIRHASEPFVLASTLHGGAPRTIQVLPEDRLTRILALNRELATVHALQPLLERVVEHAVALLRAERGYVLLFDGAGELVVHAVRGQDDDETHRNFSRSIAARAVASGEPIVSLSARDDDRMAGFTSVHQIMLQSVACVPIRSPRGESLGALYLETRTRRGKLFEREIGTLSAFADQAAIAMESARLLEENQQRAEALARANGELETARARLAELLDHKTAQLAITRRDLKDTRAVLQSHFGYKGLVGTSVAMRRVYALIDRVKDADVSVIITGESGTGKEVVARAIHQGSTRGKRPFTGINCGAIPEHLLESELFGHTRGAFTGADRDRKGLFRDTEGGTLLLDEVGEMSMKMQASLLRVLQEKVVRPVGSSHEEPIDVRVLAATHRDLSAMIEAKTFREDLYYRLRVVEVRVPALRERPEDIPALIDHFLQLFAARYRREKGSVSREALRALMAFKWPGNVRQLEHVLLNGWVLSDAAELIPDDFDLPGAPASELLPLSSPSPSSSPLSKPLTEPHPPPETMVPPPSSADSSLQGAGERENILTALEEHDGNRVRAAEALAMPRRTFYRRLKEYGIQ